MNRKRYRKFLLVPRAASLAAAATGSFCTKADSARPGGPAKASSARRTRELRAAERIASDASAVRSDPQR